MTLGLLGTVELLYAISETCNSLHLLMKVAVIGTQGMMERSRGLQVGKPEFQIWLLQWLQSHLISLAVNFHTCQMWSKIKYLLMVLAAVIFYHSLCNTSMIAQMVKNLPAMWATWVQSLGREDPLGKGNATHPSILAWKTPWTEEPGRLESMGLQRLRYDWATFSHSLTLYNMPQYLGSSFIISLFTYWSVPLFNIYIFLFNLQKCSLHTKNYKYLCIYYPDLTDVNNLAIFDSDFLFKWDET